MSDIQKLQTVIDSLEAEAEKVNEFSGVITTLRSLSDEISVTKNELIQQGSAQKTLIENNQAKLDEYGRRLSALEEQISSLESKILTADNFDSGLSLVLSKLTKLKFLKPAQFDSGIKATEEKLRDSIHESGEELERIVGTRAEKSVQIVIALSVFFMIFIMFA